jgi:hypothetical protein
MSGTGACASVLMECSNTFGPRPLERMTLHLESAGESTSSAAVG